MLHQVKFSFGFSSLWFSSGLIVPTRSDYGGRNSIVTVVLPFLVLSFMFQALWVFHSSSYGSVLMICWFILGLCFMLSDFYRSGMWESRFQGTTSYRINTLGSFIYLVCFESAFFAGTYWLMSLSRIHGVSDVSYRSSTSGSDLCFSGSFESLDCLVNLNIHDSSAFLYVSSDFSTDYMSEIMVPIMLNLWILLMVSLLLQFGHRFIQIRELC